MYWKRAINISSYDIKFIPSNFWDKIIENKIYKCEKLLEVYIVIYHVIGTSFKKIFLKQPSYNESKVACILYVTLASHII